MPTPTPDVDRRHGRCFPKALRRHKHLEREPRQVRRLLLRSLNVVRERAGMAGHHLLSLGFAAMCLLVAAILWMTVGKNSAAPQLPNLPRFAAAPPAARPAAVSSGALGVAAGQNLQGAINNANDRTAAAIAAGER
jgi:hypothetical protein